MNINYIYIALLKFPLEIPDVIKTMIDGYKSNDNYIILPNMIILECIFKQNKDFESSSAECKEYIDFLEGLII